MLISRAGVALDVLVVSGIVVAWIIIKELVVVRGMSDLTMVEIAWVEVEHVLCDSPNSGRCASSDNNCFVNWRWFRGIDLGESQGDDRDETRGPIGERCRHESASRVVCRDWGGCLLSLC